MDQEVLKQNAAQEAVKFVEDGMFVGLGTGSTAKYVVEFLGEKFKNGEIKIKATPTSVATKNLAESYGIEMVDLDQINDGEVDVVIDGADQIDLVSGVCIKGGGGAHYWEKMVAEKSKKMVVVVDESKIVDSFEGFKIPLEVEVSKKEELASAIEVVYREKLSDFGNAIGDVVYDGSVAIEEFEEHLLSLPGVIETGIFISLVDYVVVAKSDGAVEVYEIDYN